MCFLVCSSFPLLANQTVLEFPLGRAALHLYFHRQKLAVHNDAPTLLPTNRRD